jgi:putative pyruvate formate lyase activating enzyme
MDKQARKEIAARMGSAWEAMRACALCPRGCGVDRTRGQKGYCGLGAKSRCFREMIYDREEEGLNPSHQVYFAGCNLRCGFCSVMEWNEEPDAAKETDVKALAEAVRRRQAAGAKTLNLLGGEPAVSIYGVLELLSEVGDDAVVVWNSNMYYGQKVGQWLEGLVDIWLADFKCGNEKCAKLLLDAGDYVGVVRGNIEQVVGHGEVIVRHVVMPGHVECCTKPIMEWLGGLAGVKVSLKLDYVPPVEEGSSPMGYLGEKDATKAMEFARQAKVSLVK